MARVRRGLRWIFLRGLCFGGLVGGLAFFVVSVSPSLLPRGWLFQGLVSGISVAIGYGLGSAVSSVIRRFGVPEPSPVVKRRVWWGLASVAVVAVLAALWWGNEWNQATRAVMGMEGLETWAWLPVLLIAAVVFVLILIVARGVRLLARQLIGFAERWLPRRVSIVIGAAIAAVVFVGFLQGFLLDPTFDAIGAAYSLGDRDTTPGIVQPTSPLRSGSPDSLVAWDSLGTKGRDFTGAGGGGEKEPGPSAEQIERFNGAPAMEPIRAYVGLRSADTLDERVELAIDELERTDAFNRSVLAVYATTGTGWVDERVADSLEYIWKGDTAAVAMQYSFLPSWVSVLVDAETAADTSIALLEAVNERVESMPEAERPRVFVFGESLGSYATEEALGGLDEAIERVDGALLVGPTFFNEMRGEFTDNRDEASPAWRPVYEGGERVRFAVEPADFENPAGPWDEPRIAYLQNSSDPISFFSVDLLWSSPEWLDQPRAPDSNPDMEWFPLVTFWQVATDLVYSFGAPAGHGHRYGANVVEGWLTLHTPDGWTDSDTQLLRDIVGHE